VRVGVKIELIEEIVLIELVAGGGSISGLTTDTSINGSRPFRVRRISVRCAHGQARET